MCQLQIWRHTLMDIDMNICGKTTYNSRTDAHWAMKKIMAVGKRLRVYKCDKCFRWHLTSYVNDKYKQI